ncbi:MAG: hypothetical protein AB2L21_06430 [Anaerolineaceae bacterium]
MSQPSSRQALNLLRSRQENAELRYWVSITAYDTRDRSLTNRLYFGYLLLFFSIWVFIVLLFLAQGGSILLRMINPANPTQAALVLTVIILSGFGLIHLVACVRRSPLSFSEEDAHLLCQQPFNPRQLVLRWLPLSWFGSAVFFALTFLWIGFSLAEASFATQMMSQFLPQYAWMGIRLVLIGLPNHLILFVVGWISGVWALARRKKPSALILPVIAGLLLIGVAALTLTALISTTPPEWISQSAQVLLSPILAGFDAGSLRLPAALVIYLIAIGVGLILLSASSSHFSASRAAVETQLANTIQNLTRYGQSASVENIRLKHRLGLGRTTKWQPAWTGISALVWKDVLQSWRARTLGKFWNLLLLTSTMLSLTLSPTLSLRLLSLVIWSYTLSQLTVYRLRTDLSLWSVIRQLPIPLVRVFSADTVGALGLSFIFSLGGLLLGNLIAPSSDWRLLLLLPGMLAAVTAMTAYDLLRKCRSENLSAGVVGDYGLLGMVLAALVAVIPIWLLSLPSKWLGLLIGLLSSLVLGWLGYSMVRSETHRLLWR